MKRLLRSLVAKEGAMLFVLISRRPFGREFVNIIAMMDACRTASIHSLDEPVTGEKTA